MRALIVALAILAGATSAFAQGAANPAFTRDAPVTASVIEDVSCGISSTTLLNSTSLANARALILVNEDGTNFVDICTAATCTAATGFKLVAGAQVTLPLGPDSDTLTCIANTGAVVVGYIVLK